MLVMFLDLSTAELLEWTLIESCVNGILFFYHQYIYLTILGNEVLSEQIS